MTAPTELLKLTPAELEEAAAAVEDLYRWNEVPTPPLVGKLRRLAQGAAEDAESAAARDDAAELKAQFHEWWSAYVNVASRLGMTSVDDAGRLGAVATAEEINAEITRRERNAAELRAALKAVVDLDWEHYLASDPLLERRGVALRAVAAAEAALAATEGKGE